MAVSHHVGAGIELRTSVLLTCEPSLSSPLSFFLNKIKIKKSCLEGVGYTLNPSPGESREKGICEFEASLVYRLSSRTVIL